MSEIGPLGINGLGEGIKNSPLKNDETMVNPPDKERNFFEHFERRVKEETDIYKLVDGIMPPESIFDPKNKTRKIQTDSGFSDVKNIAELSRAEQLAYRELLQRQGCDAYFNLYSREIRFDSKIDRVQTVKSVANGDFTEVALVMLAHEALHSHQNPLLQRPSSTEIEKITDKEQDLTKLDAERLAARARDLSILQETQAYILQYSLTGGSNNPDYRARSKTLLTEIISIAEQKGQKDIEGEPIDEFIKRINSSEADGIRFSDFSENGYPPVMGYIEYRLIKYLPEKDRNNKDYLERIHKATTQIIRLLDKGMSHRQIADLMREHRNEIHEGREWDERRKGYKFLQEAIDQNPNQDAIDDEELMKKFNRRTEERVLKIRSIAKDALPPAPLTGEISASGVEKVPNTESDEIKNPMIISNVDYDLEWYRRGFIKDNGLSESATWEEISNSLIDNERKRIARISDLPESATWDEINRYGNTEVRLKEARMTHLPDAEKLTWEQIIRSFELTRRSWVAEESGFSGIDRFNATWDDIEKARNGQAREYQARKWGLDIGASWQEITDTARNKQARLWGLPDNSSWENITENWNNIANYRINKRNGAEFTEPEQEKLEAISENARKKHAEYYDLPDTATWEQIIAKHSMQPEYSPETDKALEEKIIIYYEKVNRGEALAEAELDELEVLLAQTSITKDDPLYNILNKMFASIGRRM